MITRCLMLAATLIAGHLLVGYLEDGYSFGSVIPPQRSFNDVPMTLGSWHGEDEAEPDPGLIEFLQARDGVNRVYTDTVTQNQVAVHAVWTDDYIKIHFPEQCYRETGWALTKSSDVNVEKSDGESFPAKLLTFQREGTTKYVLYWFQFGDHYFFDRWRQRELRREICWGQKEWPPLMKFMLDTTSPDESTGRESLLKIAAGLHASINTPQKIEQGVKPAEAN